MHVEWILLLLSFACISAHPEEASATPGCYDCNFAPSGYIRTTEGSSKKVGYVRCALQQDSDFALVDSTPCPSGRCFIRIEDNGLEYRGCAEQENLPLGVDSNLQCKYQGPGTPLWYFCDGNNCNFGQIGQDEEHCGQSFDYATQASDSGHPQSAQDSSASDANADHSALVAHSPEALPPVHTDELPYYSEFEYDSDYTGSDDEGADTDLGQQDTSSPNVHDTDPSNNYHPKSDYHPKFGYAQDTNSKSGYNQPPSKSHTGKSDYAYRKSEVGNSDAAYNRPSLPFPPALDRELQLYAKEQPDDFLRQFGFWYFLMPAYWKYYFGYSNNSPFPQFEYEPESQSTTNDYGETPDYSGGSDEFNGDYMYTSSDGDHRTPEDNDGQDTKESIVDYDQHGRYNPCHGCEDNPSGLYPDETRRGQFIQCGCAIYDGVPCTCCYAFPMNCPSNTRFSNTTKTCVRFGDYPQHG